MHKRSSYNLKRKKIIPSNARGRYIDINCCSPGKGENRKLQEKSNLLILYPCKGKTWRKSRETLRENTFPRSDFCLHHTCIESLREHSFVWYYNKVNEWNEILSPKISTSLESFIPPPIVSTCWKVHPFENVSRRDARLSGIVVCALRKKTRLFN